MTAPETARAVRAALALAGRLRREAADARVLHASNAVTVLLEPCGVVARVRSGGARIARSEVRIAAALDRAGAPVVPALPRADPQVHEEDGLVISLWEHRPGTGAAPAPAAYADALRRLHAALREVDIPAPPATDRVDAALALLADPARTPRLRAADRTLLTAALEELRAQVADASGGQLLHGEPHPGNVLATADGPLFLDFETCCRGPVELDLAHAPAAVAAHYPGADARRVESCRRLVLAMVTTWRFDRDDAFPDGARLGEAWLADLREGRDPFAG